MIIYGINPTLEALRAGTVTEVQVSDLQNRRVATALERAKQAGTIVRRVESAELDRISRGGAHQGVVASVNETRVYSVWDLVREAKTTPLIVVLDGIKDPQNLGAIIRSAEAAGVDGIIRQTRRAAPPSAAAIKASAGAVAHVRMASVVNIARAITELKELGIWTIGLDNAAERSYDTLDLTQPTALVVGGEATGLRRLVRERCDWLASIPMRGYVSSLNVSVATGIALFEVFRQRSAVSKKV